MTDTNNNELVAKLHVQIERAWNAKRDDTVVDQLASEHPELAEDLYIFFADVVAMTLEPYDPRPDLADADDRTRKWLEADGNRRVAKAYEESNVGLTPTPSGRNFLGMLKETTGRTANDLAASLKISAAFLLDVSQHADIVPERVRLEFARRVERAWEVNEAETLQTFQRAPSAMQRAASRTGAYEQTAMTYATMVHRSGLDETQQRYWLSLE